MFYKKFINFYVILLMISILLPWVIPLEINAQQASSTNYSLTKYVFSSGNPNSVNPPSSNNFLLTASSYGAIADQETYSLNYFQFPGFLTPISSSSFEEQIIELIEGYSFVSTRIIPESPNMQFICNDILDNLDFVRNTAGLMLRKIGPMWINGIGDWVTTEGYLFKMNNTDELIISGEVINPQTPISLFSGYQFVSFLPENPIDALIAFGDVLNNLDFVRNTAGLMLRKIGPMWINGIGNMQPGEGYLVKMIAPDVLIYPVSDEKFTGITNIKPEYFIFEGGNAADPVYTIYIDGLESGDEVAAFDGDILLGAMKVNSQNAFDNDLPVFSTLNSGKGFKVGNPIILKVWETSTQSLIPFEYTMTDPYNEAYLGNIYPEEDGLYSVLKITKGINITENVSETISIFPNPSKGIFNISIEGVNGNIQLKVIDIHGMEYYSYEIQGMKSIATTHLDLNELSAGVYFIRFSGKDFSQVKKVVIQ